MTNQASEDEQLSNTTDREEWRNWLASNGLPHNEVEGELILDFLEGIIRTEKLKLLAEVRERVVGEDRTSDDPRDFHLDIRNKLRANQREQLTKLEAEL